MLSEQSMEHAAVAMLENGQLRLKIYGI